MNGNNQLRSVRGSGVESLAERVLRTLAVTRSDGRASARPDIVMGLCMAVRDFDPNARREWVGDVKRLGVSADEICEFYIPAAARVLGDQWCSDQVGFADVTIGVARLQGMLRDLMPDAAVQSGARKAKLPVVLMVVPEGEYHTLGAMVAARAMRQKGVSVKLAMDKPINEIKQLVSTVRFDAVMISVSTGGRLEKMRQFILNLRDVAHDGLPILVGGPIVSDHTDIKALTGADHVDTDPIKALLACGLTTSDIAAFPTSSKA